MDPPGVGETHVVGMHELQTCTVQVFGSKEGEVNRQILLQAGRTSDPGSHRESLGKVFNCRLNDRDSIKATGTDLEGWVRTLHKSGLPGKFKAWVYQHRKLPRILWPLLIYEIPMTVVEGLEQKVSSYLCRWLGLPCSLSNIDLYGNTNKLSQGGVHHCTGTGTPAVLWIQRCQSVQHRDHWEDREEVEGSRCSPANRDSTEAQDHPWRSDARQSWTWEPNSDPI